MTHDRGTESMLALCDVAASCRAGELVRDGIASMRITGAGGAYRVAWDP
jgi:hypothetical protein